MESRLNFRGITFLLILGAAIAGVTFVSELQSETSYVDGPVKIETFEVSPGGLLNINVVTGEVKVHSSPSTTARVEFYLTGKDVRRSRSFFDDLNFRVSYHNNAIRVESDRPRMINWSRTGNARIGIVAYIPDQFDTEISTASGSVELANLKGTVRVATSGGNIAVENLIGSSVDLRTSGGNISAERLEGDHITARTSGGHIEVGEVAGRQVSLRTSGGHIRAALLDGDDVDVRTSGGNIIVSDSYGRSEFRTSGGGIEVTRLEGDLRAVTSGGNIRVTLLNDGNVTLRTSGGGITINAPSSLRADINLKANLVRVDGGFPFEGTLRSASADGKINGGGPGLTASTSGGSISLARLY